MHLCFSAPGHKPPRSVQSPKEEDMGICKHCGQPAGFLKSAHNECKEKYTVGKQQIIELVSRAVGNREIVPTLGSVLADLEYSHCIDNQTARALVIEEWERAVERAFDDGILTEEEDNNLGEIKGALELSQEDLDRNGAYTKLVKGAVLRDVLNGVIPQRMRIEGSLPFNLQRNETLVWVFSDAKYLEQKTRSQYVGGSRGTSVRICKGVYWRVGSFRGHSVPYTETTTYPGYVGVTTKHLYFAGAGKSFRVRYDKIVSWEPYSDGIGIMRDGANAKPQSFITGDGWFTYNLVMNLARM